MFIRYIKLVLLKISVSR